MESWILPATLWLGLMLLVLRSRHGKSIDACTRRIVFKPTEEVSADDLFGYLLSANFALLEQDDFNQLGSALSSRRVDAILARHWGVSSRKSCMRIIRQRMSWLGATSPEEEAAIAAWRQGSAVESEEYKALVHTCWFLSREAGIVEPWRIRGIHLTLIACDISQIAYLVRLGVSAGYLSREMASDVLGVLRKTAKARFGSWEDYSLCTLIGMGMRCRFDLSDVADWYAIARTHRVLLSAEGGTLSCAAGWADRAASWSERPRMGRAYVPRPAIVD